MAATARNSIGLVGGKERSHFQANSFPSRGMSPTWSKNGRPLACSPNESVPRTCIVILRWPGGRQRSPSPQQRSAPYRHSATTSQRDSESSSGRSTGSSDDVLATASEVVQKNFANLVAQIKINGTTYILRPFLPPFGPSYCCD